jgi:hypothetical protein
MASLRTLVSRRHLLRPRNRQRGLFLALASQSSGVDKSLGLSDAPAVTLHLRSFLQVGGMRGNKIDRAMTGVRRVAQRLDRPRG